MREVRERVESLMDGKKKEMSWCQDVLHKGIYFCHTKGAMTRERRKKRVGKMRGREGEEISPSRAWKRGEER